MACNEWDIYTEPETTFYGHQDVSWDWSDSEYIATTPQDVDSYDGPYTFTPTNQVQVIGTRDKLMLEDVTINPIPSNYGLITYNGSIITVS